jgi:DNA-binding CsgD family transcriptional regulator
VINGNKGSSLEVLSEREFEVFQMIANGSGPKEIGQKLQLSVKTVETHRAHIKEKLGIKSAAELSRFVSQWALKQV